MDNTKWTDNPTEAEINKTITDVCVRIIQEPLIYFSEADIQQLLAEELRKISSLRKIYPTKVEKGKGSVGKYHTSLIHREYGGGEGTRIDVVILDPQEVKNIDDANLTKGKKYLYPLYAFELGTEKSADAQGHLENDLKKLENATKIGYYIHFYKDATKSGTQKSRRQKTEKKIKQIFKKAFEDKRKPENTNIKILAILIRTGRDQKKMRGKCEIFNGQSWQKVNVNVKGKIRDAIMQQLKP